MGILALPLNLSESLHSSLMHGDVDPTRTRKYEEHRRYFELQKPVRALQQSVVLNEPKGLCQARQGS